MRVISGPLKDWSEAPTFPGCAFIKASIELADPAHPRLVFARGHKERSHAFLETLTEQVLGKEAAKLAPPSRPSSSRPSCSTSSRVRAHHDEGDGQLAGRARRLTSASAGRRAGDRWNRLVLEVAEIDGCGDCLAAHDAVGKHSGLDDEERLAIRRGHPTDPGSEVALGFARKLPQGHGRVMEGDVRLVKDADFSDGDVAEIIAHVALNIPTDDFNIAVEPKADFPSVPFLDSPQA